jgi:hypothetical protein
METFPGFRFAIQLQSIDDPGLFGDYVLWEDEASCEGAGELAARSAVCQAYFRATGDELLFAHLSSDGTEIAADTGRRGEIVEFVHLPVSHPLASPAALREVERSIRTLTGVVAVEAGELAGDIGPGAGIIVVWADTAASEAGARVIAGLFETRSDVALDAARSWRFRARDWFARSDRVGGRLRVSQTGEHANCCGLQDVSTTGAESGGFGWTAVNEPEGHNRL